MLAKTLSVFAVSLLLAAPLSAAEEKKPAPKPLSLTVGRTIRLQMAKKQIIKTVVIDREGVVKVAPAFNDPRTLLITGLAPGKVRIVVTGEDGQKMALNLGE
jgi:hypothetical protein